jgi:hypothetical protein
MRKVKSGIRGAMREPEVRIENSERIEAAPVCDGRRKFTLNAEAL